LAFAALEGTLALFLRRRMDWDARSAAFAFAGLGLLSAMVQGGLIRRLVPELGEPRLIVAGLITVSLGFAGLALVSNAFELAGALVLVGVGQGLVSPSLSGLLSRITPASEQGAVFGTLTSAQTLARMISYSTANLLLGRVSTSAPYWFGFALYLASLLAAARFLAQLNIYLNQGRAEGTEVPAAAAHGTVE
jgi:DHA1 family tetracycline resistance protein-like MFS transporter